MHLSLSLAVVSAATALVLPIAENFPNFNVAPGCKAADAVNQAIDLSVPQSYQGCIKEEQTARAQLQRNWTKYSDQAKQLCVNQTTDGGAPSYVEVQECLLVTSGVNVPMPNIEAPQNQ